MKVEGDPSLPEDERTGPGYAAYFERMMETAKKGKPGLADEPRSDYERTFLRLMRKIRQLAGAIMESEYRVWPVCSNTHKIGTAWGQPYWRMRLLRSFLSGYQDALDDENDALKRAAGRR
jgi:hypothetical protein